MALRYDGNDSTGTRDLHVLAPGAKTTAAKAGFGDVTTLLRWHCNDAVSASEIHRNNTIYQAQGNRNPYVDAPQWVEAIHGACETGMSPT